MNYGLLNLKAQNGRPQIFWSNEKAKKTDRKFGYKTRDQRFMLRQYPTDLRTDPDNLLQPAEPPEEEKPKKPAKNFIKRNRDNLAKKNKENDQTVTLTQEQLNAILASVGKVASGKEDALRISIDADKHVIKVESPGREDGGKREKRYRRKKDDDSEQSIFALMDDNKKSRDKEEKSRRDRRDRTPDREDSGDRYRSRKHSGDRDHHRKHSNDRDYRNHSHEHYREHSSDRHRKHSGERYRRDSRERGRSHSRDRRHHSSDRYRTPSRERRRHSPDDRTHERRRYSPDDRSRERRQHSPYDRYRRDSPSEGRHRKSTPEREDHRNDKPKEDNPHSPREIAGIPVSLPWKHMTKAERRRKEEEEKKKNYQELETKIHKNFKKDDYRRDDYRREDYNRRDDDRISDSDRGSSLKTSSLPPTTNGRMSLGEMKRRQWEKERADTSTTGDFQPWGKPGAGAPIRTKSGNLAADYSRRKEGDLERVDEEKEMPHRRHHSSPPREKRGEPTREPRHEVAVSTQESIPAAMRSSIAFGQGADAESMMKTKELERQKWVQELDKQREEKRLREINEMNVIKASEETWADKFSNPYRPAPLPDQTVKQFGPEEHLITKQNEIESRRTSSAPNQPPNDEPSTFIRGQNVFMDSATHKELEEKRKRHLEHQKAIMEQVQEKQRQKQLERERKMKEDLEEEMKLQIEKEKQQKIFDSEIQKNKNREMRRQQQVENLKAAMDEAHDMAQRDKYQKRVQHLEEAGHDVSHLKANLQAKLTPRATEPTYVPGLNLDTSPRGIQTENQSVRPNLAIEPYTENRILTPSQFRHGLSPKREFGTQTADLKGYIETRHHADERTYREMTDIDIVYKPSKGKKVRVKSAKKEEKMSYKPVPKQRRPISQKLIPEKKEPERPSRSRKKELWNYQNPKHKQPIKQSEKDPIKQKREISEHRRKIREQELLSMVEMNKDRIPTERLSRCDSHSDGEITPRTDRLCRRNKSHSPEVQPEVNRLVINRSWSRTPEETGRELVPFRDRSPSPLVPVLRNDEHIRRFPSPPVPALKHKMGGDGGFELHGKLSKYGDNNPLTSELGDSEFVPFTRTVEILDPAMATRPLAVSREATQVANARKAYIKGMKPGDYGNRVDVYEDRIRLPGDSKSDKDPITNPSLVKNHPTHRQDQILNQLSSLKESLIQRQRELETFSPTDLE